MKEGKIIINHNKTDYFLNIDDIWEIAEVRIISGLYDYWTYYIKLKERIINFDFNLEEDAETHRHNIIGELKWGY